MAYFVLLAISAGLLAPIALVLGRQISGEAGRWSVRVGVAAAVVQVIGLMRWPLIVPFLADREDTDAFETVHTVLGTVVGETLGYALTATWTVLIVKNLARHLGGTWLAVVGYVAAGLIALGVLVPLGVPGADFAYFLGYVVWSVWLLVLAGLIWTRSERVESLGVLGSRTGDPAVTA